MPRSSAIGVIRGSIMHRRLPTADDAMLEWIKDNTWLLWTLSGVSAGLFVLTIIALPIIVARLPADYFTRTERGKPAFDHMSPTTQKLLLIAKNTLGVVILLAGVAMLVLPGQGMLAIFVGAMLVDFPGKRRLERWLVARRGVKKTLDWIRRKAGRPPLHVGTSMR